MPTNPLFEALQGSLYSAQSDPFGIGAQALGASLPLLQNPYQSTGTNLAYSVGGSLLAGLLGGLAQRRTNERNQELMGQFYNMMNADPAARQAIIQEEPRLASLGMQLQMEDLAAKSQQAREDYIRGKDLEKALTLEQAKTYLDQGQPIDLKTGIPLQVGGEGLIPLKSKQELELEKAYKTKTEELKAEQDFRKELFGKSGNQKGSTLEQIAGLPKDLQDTAVTELGELAKRDEAIAFIKEQFKRSKDLSSIRALDPTGLTSEAKELAGIQESLGQAVQALTGKEMSDPRVKRFMALVPRGVDSNSQIDSKEARFLGMLNTMLEKTPILNEIGASAQPLPTPTPTIPAPKTVVGPDGQTYVFVD